MSDSKTTQTQTVISHLEKFPILPAISISDVNDALPLAQALVEGGLSIMEISLHTSAALDAITQITKAYPDVLVGAGTITNPEKLANAESAGAQFGLSPGITPDLLKTAAEKEWPFIPGVITPSEVMRAQDMGFKLLRFFPAESGGGIQTLKTFVRPFHDVQFVPTGGIQKESYMAYLRLSNVIAISGSWIAPAYEIRKKDWNSITQRAQDTLKRLNYSFS